MHCETWKSEAWLRVRKEMTSQRNGTRAECRHACPHWFVYSYLKQNHQHVNVDAHFCMTTSGDFREKKSRPFYPPVLIFYSVLTNPAIQTVSIVDERESPWCVCVKPYWNVAFETDKGSRKCVFSYAMWFVVQNGDLLWRKTPQTHIQNPIVKEKHPHHHSFLL